MLPRLNRYTCLTPLKDKAGVVNWGTCKDCLLRPHSILSPSFNLRLEIGEVLIVSLPPLALTATFLVGDGEREQLESSCTTFCDKVFTTNYGGVSHSYALPIYRPACTYARIHTSAICSCSNSISARRLRVSFSSTPPPFHPPPAITIGEGLDLVAIPRGLLVFDLLSSV